jgi:CTP synthase (UTP-ammonia lyase)
VAGLTGASHAEYGGEGEAALVAPVACAAPPSPGTPALNDVMAIRIEPGTRARAVFGADMVHERFTCNYELNAAFEGRLVEAGLKVSGRGEGGEARVIELADHPYYLATLFLPQYGSAPGRPHRFVTGFLEAAGGRAPTQG